MQTISATEAKQKFAALLDSAQRHDQDIAVLVSAEEFKRMSGKQWAELDRLMDEISAEAKTDGFTEKDLEDILAEK